MLEVKIEIDLIPFGYRDRKRNIKKITIINSGDHDDRPLYGNYVVKWKYNNLDLKVYIKDFERSKGCVELLKEACEAIIEKESFIDKEGENDKK